MDRLEAYELGVGWLKRQIPIRLVLEVLQMIVDVDVKSLFTLLDGVGPYHHLEIRLLDWIELLPWELKIDLGLDGTW